MKYLLLLLSLTLTACDLFGGAPQQVPQRVTLTASQTESEIPFAVTFTAEASPAVSVFSWTIGGETQTETSNTLTQTFDRSGLYVVSVSANGASDSLTVTADSPRRTQYGAGYR